MMKLNPIKVTPRTFKKNLLTASICLGFASTVGANPSGMSVVAGQASAQAVGDLLGVTNSPGAILNWEQFSIGAGETTRFIQESTASHVVNRVVGGDPSQILGALQSNGHVFLINPSGVIFGQGAQIDTAGLLASTLNITDAQLKAEDWSFVADAGGAGAIVNNGHLNAHSGGSIVLLAPQVENNGIIHADGEVLLAAGHEVSIVDLRYPTLGLRVKAEEGDQAVNLGQVVGENISIFSSLVKHSGVVEATGAQLGQGGVVRFRGDQGVELASDSVVSADGDRGGVVDIRASEGLVLASGTVSAQGATGQGGDIVLTGQGVAVLSGAQVSADGYSGGGTIALGGGWRGGDTTIQNSKRTLVQDNVSISANALQAGDGGEVVVWADEIASVSSVIEAKGGALSGNGGRVETSGKLQMLDVTPADTSAPNGQAGEWLLDPANLTVVETIPAGGEPALAIGNPPNFFQSDLLEVPALETFVTASDVLTGVANNGSVILTTILQGGPDVNAPGNITIDAPLLFNVPSFGDLFLDAAGAVFINQPIGFAPNQVSGSELFLGIWSGTDVLINAPLGVNATATNSSFFLETITDIDRAVVLRNTIDVGVVDPQFPSPQIIFSVFDDPNIIDNGPHAPGVSFESGFSTNANAVEIYDFNFQGGLALDISVTDATLNFPDVEVVDMMEISQTSDFVPVNLTIGSGGVINAASFDVESLSIQAGGVLNLNDGFHSVGVLQPGDVLPTGFVSAFKNAGTINLAGTLDLGTGITLDQAAGSLFMAPGSIITGSVNLAGGQSRLHGLINGNLNVGAAVFRPGSSPGQTSIQGDLTLGANSTTVIEIQGNGDRPGIDYDFIFVSGNASLNGALRVIDISALGAPGRGGPSNPDGNPLNIRQDFPFFNAASISGAFSSYSRTLRDSTYTFSEVSLLTEPDQRQTLFVTTEAVVTSTDVPTEVDQTFNPPPPEQTLQGTESDQPPPPPPPPPGDEPSEEDEEKAKDLAQQEGQTQPVSQQSEQLTVRSTRSNPTRPADGGQCQ